LWCRMEDRFIDIDEVRNVKLDHPDLHAAAAAG
jgi:hypothetical protein